MPLHPQDRALAMALGIPVAEGEERRVAGLADVVVGARTAILIAWAGGPAEAPRP